MAHTLAGLIAWGIAVLLFGCDNTTAPKVPRDATGGITPVEFALAPVTPEIAPEDEDPVLAWVNGEAIHESDLSQNLHRVRARNPHGAIDDARREQVLLALIDERLIDQWLADRVAPVSADDVDAELQRVTHEVFGSRESLLRHLDRRNTTLTDYRAALRRTLAERKLLSAEIAPTTDEALSDLYREVANRPATRTRLLLSSVLVGSGIGGDFVGVKSEGDFKHIPGRHVALGWVEREAMSDQLARTVLAVDAPGASQPVSTPAGTELYWVHERTETFTPHFSELEPLLRGRAKDISISHARSELLRRLRKSSKVQRSGVENGE